MKCEEIELGEIFEIKVGEDRVRTKLQEITEDDDLIVLQPTVRGVPLRPESGAKCEVSFFRPKGIFMFEADMVSAFIRNEIRLCRLRQTSEVRKIQRRQFYRLPIVLKVMVSAEGRGEVGLCKAKTVNISEKSVEFTCFAAFEIGDEVKTQIWLTATDSITIKGEVIKCIRPINKSEPLRVVVLFRDEGARSRTLLRRYIFRQQVIARSINRNGLTNGK